jgi:purine catabolism regulator
LKNETIVYLNEILALPLFEHCRVITKESPLSQCATSINVMLDKEIVEWLGKDQILLTTGKVVEKLTVEEQIELFRAIRSKAVSAVFIKISPYLPALPEAVIDTCNEIGLVIVDLDYEVTFTNIFSHVYELMFNKQSTVLKRVENLHQDTMQVVVSGGGIEDVLRSVHKTISVPVFVRDYYFENTYFVKSAFSDDYTLLYENIENVHFEGKNGKLIHDTVPYRGREIERLLVPIVVKNQVYGHLVAYGTNQGISNYDQLGLESTSHIVALDFLKKISVHEVENKYKLEFFDDLISLDEDRRAKAIERAANFRFIESAQYAMLCLRLVGKNQAEDQMRVVYLLELICKDMGHAYLILNKSECIYVLVMLKEGEGVALTKRYATYIYDVLKGKMKKHQIKIGVGRIVKGLLNGHKSKVDAYKALEAAANYLPKDVVFFEEMGVYKILSQSSIRQELEHFAEEVLGKLVAYDQRRDTELIKTLEVYFACNGNLKKMSESLYTHYNTILYRLNRIQEIIELSLDNEEHRFAIQTALKVNLILKE